MNTEEDLLDAENCRLRRRVGEWRTLAGVFLLAWLFFTACMLYGAFHQVDVAAERDKAIAERDDARLELRLVKAEVRGIISELERGIERIRRERPPARKRLERAGG